MNIERLFASPEIPAAKAVVMLDLINQGKALAYFIAERTPSGPDQSAAIRKVREAVWTATAGLMLDGTI